MKVNHIYNEDCLEGMKKHIPDQSIDIIVTSPPYNIGIKYNSYNDNKSDLEYYNWLELISQECSRVLKDYGSLFLNVGQKPSEPLKSFYILESFKKNFFVQNVIHWVKSIAVPEHNINIGHYKPVNSQRFLNDCHEYVFHLTKYGNVKIDKIANGVPYKDKSNVGRYSNEDLRDRGNIWYIPYETTTQSKKHPASFPIKLPEMCIKMHGFDYYTNILDPFMGIGQTAKACKNLGCNYVGFEIDKGYIDVFE